MRRHFRSIDSEGVSGDVSEEAVSRRTQCVGRDTIEGNEKINCNSQHPSAALRAGSGDEGKSGGHDSTQEAAFIPKSAFICGSCCFCVRLLVAQTHNRIQDRKSTRLNSSHSQISYAVFCLKKKK